MAPCHPPHPLHPHQHLLPQLLHQLHSGPPLTQEVSHGWVKLVCLGSAQHRRRCLLAPGWSSRVRACPTPPRDTSSVQVRDCHRICHLHQNASAGINRVSVYNNAQQAQAFSSGFVAHIGNIAVERGPQSALPLAPPYKPACAGANAILCPIPTSCSIQHAPSHKKECHREHHYNWSLSRWP